MLCENFEHPLEEPALHLTFPFAPALTRGQVSGSDR